MVAGVPAMRVPPITAATAALAAVLLAPAPALADYVYCANGKIEVESRSPEQMRIARGSDVC
jgi:hypothetical protein